MEREKAATYLTGIALLIGVFDSPPTIAEAMLKAVTASIFFTAIFELYPVLASKKGKSAAVLSTAAIAVALFLIGGLYAFYNDFKAGGIYIASGVIALLIVLFGLFGDKAVPQETA